MHRKTINGLSGIRKIQHPISHEVIAISSNFLKF